MVRELSAAIARSENACFPHWLRQGLHITPGKIREFVQQEIDKIESWQEELAPHRKYDAIALGYGLCGGGVSGLRAGKLPLVIPRTDDCIGILLGSQARYLKTFYEVPGIYWFSPGWIESADIPCPERDDYRFAQYTEQFGEDNAQYLMEEISHWIEKYKNGIYILSDLCDNGPFLNRTRELSSLYRWNYSEVQGDGGLMEKLISGQWDEENFLVCPPGHTIVESNDERKVIAVLSNTDVKDQASAV
jgi:hypothetical protein